MCGMIWITACNLTAWLFSIIGLIIFYFWKIIGGFGLIIWNDLRLSNLINDSELFGISPIQIMRIGPWWLGPADSPALRRRAVFTTQSASETWSRPTRRISESFFKKISHGYLWDIPNPEICPSDRFLTGMVTACGLGRPGPEPPSPTRVTVSHRRWQAERHARRGGLQHCCWARHTLKISRLQNCKLWARPSESRAPPRPAVRRGPAVASHEST